MFKKLLLGSLILSSSFSVFGKDVNDDKTGNSKNVSESIECPEQVERNYDELLTLWAANGNQTVECDFNRDAAILYDDSVYLNRLYALPSQMELAYNPIVKRFIEMYADRRRGQVSYMLGQGSYYFPLFEEALDREGLPLELKYLPVIESALNPLARSKAGATGLWQFMAATGKMYKLEINSLVDERRDPYKSTQAAVKYLKDMYAVYGDWNLVIAAYNCGPGNVNKAIKRSGGKRDYWEIYEYLPKETRGYVPIFIAATYIMNYYADHNICPSETELPALVDTLSINKLVHLQQIADVIDIPLDEIRRLNPQFKDDIIPGGYKEYSLKLPIHNLSSFIQNEDTIYAHRADELLTHQRTRSVAAAGNAPASGGYATYKVKSGDTQGAIAMRHGVSLAQLKSWNSLKSDNLKLGQSLQVSAYVEPTRTEKQVAANNPKVQNEETSEFVAEDGVLKKSTTVTKTTTSSYKVRSGDTWPLIAKNTGASVAEIKRWNGIKNNKLTSGRTFKIHKIETVEELTEIEKPKELTLDNLSRATAYLQSYIENLDIPEPNMTLGLLNPTEEEADVSGDLDELQEAVYHKVVYGETMSQIAARYNVTVEDILSWNNITKDKSSQLTRLLILLPHAATEIANSDAEGVAQTAHI